MSRYWNDTSYYSQPTTSELQRKSAESRRKAKKGCRVLEPVVIKGRSIVNS